MTPSPETGHDGHHGEIDFDGAVTGNVTDVTDRKLHFAMLRII
ncbi:hypothetical protein ACNJX9_16585 [Bradyrhizobium sp. DASA03076]|nr:hypothetical protein [Bradyrhizobium manausense]